MNKIKQRKKEKALCPKCKNPDYNYMGCNYEPNGKHNFKCNSCEHTWQYGKSNSKYLKLK